MKARVEQLSNLAFRIATVALFIALFLLLLSTNMQKELSHDENMYVAGGALLTGTGKLMLPYKDYPFLQMPNLVLAYGGIFRASDHLLLTARLFNTLCGVALLGVIFYCASSLLHSVPNTVRFLVAAGSVILLLSSPLFIYTSGLAWNYDLPVLLTLLAVILCLRSRTSTRQTSVRKCLLVGLLVGLAVGTRLSFIPIILPFIGGILLLPNLRTLAKKLYLTGSFSLGVLTSLLPAIGLAASALAAFMFDNLGYHQITPSYWQQLGYARAMTLAGKLDYLRDVFSEPGNLALLVGFVLLVLPASISAIRARQDAYVPFVIIPALAIFLVIGALAPTPTWYQYYYPAVPLLVLGVIYGVAYLYRDERTRKWGLALFVAAVLTSGGYALPGYLLLNRSLLVEDWVPNRVHNVGVEIKKAVGEGQVLTLAPLFPLEGGVSIYEQMATGSFEWRIADLLTAQQRQQLDIPSGDDLESFLARRPPQGILVGFEGGLEEPFVKYAQSHAYKPLKLSNGATLWLP